MTTQSHIQENVEFIDTVVSEITDEQKELGSVQQILVGASQQRIQPLLITGGGGDTSTPVETSMYDELQRRIDVLEKEKVEYESDKHSIIQDVMSVAKLFKWNIDNPLINIVILPLLLYINKKILDLVFNILNKKLFS